MDSLEGRSLIGIRLLGRVGGGKRLPARRQGILSIPNRYLYLKLKYLYLNFFPPRVDLRGQADAIARGSPKKWLMHCQT